MMSKMQNILDEADAALEAASAGPDQERLESMTRFMRAFELLAREQVAWSELRLWAESRSARLLAARDALADWEGEMARIYYSGGEEEAEWALEWRSQHELAQQLFQGTPAGDLLAAHEDKEMDREFQDEAQRLALDPPSWAPRSHFWWRWPAE